MLQGWKLILSKLFIIPQRWVMVIMGFLGVVNAYTMRVALSLAITEMVKPLNKTVHVDPNACLVNTSGVSMKPVVSNTNDLFEWTDTQQGLILSAFYWGYIVGHIPGGVLVQKFGGKHCLGLGILSTAILTIVTPPFAKTGSWVTMLVLRILVGLGESTTYSALNMLLARWMPVEERAKSGSLVFAGSFLGTIISNSLSGILIEATRTWEIVFYFFGGIGILWFILWCLICYSDPESHPFISDKEKEYLRTAIPKITKERKNVPWRPILKSVPLWGLVVGQIGHTWGFFSMVTDLPKYMKEVLRYDVKSNGILSSVPYVAMFIVSVISGAICDWLIKTQYMTVINCRRLFTALSALGPAIFMVLASYSGCNRTFAVIWFTTAMGFMGTFICGLKMNTLDLASNYAGTLMSLVNGIGAISGAIAPYVIGALTQDHTVEEWRLVFWLTFVIFFVTCAVFLVLAEGDEQWWNEPSSRLAANVTMYTNERTNDQQQEKNASI